MRALDWLFLAAFWCAGAWLVWLSYLWYARATREERVRDWYKRGFR